MKIAKESGDRSGEGQLYGSLGITHCSLGDFKTALGYHESHLKIAKELGDGSGEGKAYGNLGNVHLSLGDFKTAINYYERHLKIAKELGERSGEGKAYSNLGNAYYGLGDFKATIDYSRNGLKIAKELGDRSEEGTAYGSLGNAYLSLSDFKTAIDYFERQLKIANELGERSGEGKAYSNLGNAYYRLGDLKTAVHYHKRHLKIATELSESLDEGIACGNLGYVFESLGQVSKAIEYYQTGITMLNDIRDRLQLNDGWKISLRDQYQNVYAALWRVMLADGKVTQALFSAEQGRAQSLKDLMALNYLFDANELARDRRSAVKRPPQDDRQTQLLNLQEEALRTLYDTIIDPIQDLFSGSELVFIPEGPLCLAPFAAFMTPDSKYLCESFSIRVAPSLTSLKMIVQSPVDYHHNSGVLLVGDPWFPDVTKLPALPFAKKEVEMIGKMVGCAPLVGRQATKNEVLRLLGSVALVHIAAHGSMETGEIALAPESGDEDFILTMKDVKSVQLRARLVVLSCCHSAHGEIKAEGVVGIARAFLGAGARSVLVSLWAIDDKATLEFMKNFYQRLVAGKSASEALNQAMNCMRESTEFSDVTLWGPFVLIGDDVTLEFDGSK